MRILWGCLAGLALSGTCAMAAAADDAAGGIAGIEAYRRLPFCQLAPDGRRLLKEPCRTAPAKAPPPRRAVHGAPLAMPAPPPPAAAPAPTAVPAPMAALPGAAPPASTALAGRALPLAPPSPPAVAPPVQPLQNCGPAGCSGAGGEQWRSGAGNILISPSGRACTRAGDFVHC